MKPLILAAALWLAACLPAFATIDIQEVKTPAGFTAWLVEEPSIPFVSLQIVFRGGTSIDPEGARGATYLMTGLIEEGAGDLDARGFATARDDLAAGFGFDASDDAVSVSAQFLSESTDQAVALLETALARPRFDQDAVDRVREQVLSGLRSNAEDPDEIASNAFAAQVFGDHPYGSPGEGTIDSVTALTRDDIVAAHRSAFARDRVYVAAAGDITPEKLAEVIDRLMADLPETGAPLPPDVTPAFDGSTSVVPYNTPQSAILFGQPGLPRHDDDYFAAYVLNEVLGGSGFGARLMSEVREKRGLTYGIYSYLANKDHADLLVGRAATANARAGETIAVVRDEWARMAAEGPTEAELDKAKTYLIGAYPLRFDSNDSIAEILVGMQLDGLTPEYVETRNDKVAAVTLADAKRVAAELIQPDKLTFVVVGQPEGLPPGN